MITARITRDEVPFVTRGLEAIAALQRASGSTWRLAKIAEAAYAIKLRKVATQIGTLVHGFVQPGDDNSLIEMATRAYATLLKYADILDPWAKAAAQQVIAEIAARNRQSWFTLAKEAGGDLQQQILHAPIESVTQQLVRDQVGLIKSIPLEAAQRVQTLAIEGVSSGARYKDIIDEIMRTGEVAKSRATTIARTEVARAGTALTQARSQAVGVTQYQWLTAHDGAVRPDHRILDGKVFNWDSPPISDRRTGARAHPGAIYNCRCIAAPIPPPAFDWQS